MSRNGVKNCSVSNCVNSNIVARKRIHVPTTATTPVILNKMKKATFRYFCEDHFDPAKEGPKLKVFPSSEVIVPIDDSNRSVYSNRKRKQNIVCLRPHRSKFKDEGQSYTLNEQNSRIGSDDDTVVNIQFEFEDFEDCEPKSVVLDKESEPVELPDDNDCIITEDQSTNIIDLSEEEMEEGKDGSNRMIEVILCNDIEPEDSETTREFVIDTSSYDEWNGFESQELQEPIRVNFCVLEDSGNDVCHTIDLTTEDTIENADMEIVDSVETLPKITSVRTIDLTEQLTSTEKVDNTNNAVLEKVIRNFSNKYPGTLKSLSRNSENNQLEIELCKNGLFKTEDEFKLYIMKVANLIQESQLEGDIQVKDLREIQAKGSSCPPKQQSVSSYSRPVNKSISGRRSNEISSSSNECPPKQQGASKYYLPAKKITNSQSVNRLNENSSSSSDNSATLNDSKLAKNTEIVSNYNASQILKKSKLYLGVTKTTFHTIENLLKNRFKNKSVLILLLRKIKLNESFSMLSDVLCPNKKDCISIYEEVLPELSRALQIFLRWPIYCRDTVAVVGVFEIEIKKPDSFLQQSMSFCSQRQRYLVKFLVSCTSSGYINHVSMPFYSYQDNIFTKCLESIPTNCSVVVHPNLLNFISTSSTSTRIKTFDTNSNADRNCIQSAFDRMRRFSLLNGIVDRTNLKLLQHTVSLVACVCNLEQK